MRAIILLFILAGVCFGADATAPSISMDQASAKACSISGTDWATFPSTPDTKTMHFNDGTEMTFRYDHGVWKLFRWTTAETKTVQLMDGSIGIVTYITPHWVEGATSP